MKTSFFETDTSLQCTKRSRYIFTKVCFLLRFDNQKLERSGGTCQSILDSNVTQAELNILAEPT